MNMPTRPRRYSADWVSEAEWAHISQAPLKAKALLYSMVCVFAILLIWAALAPLDEIARGEGKVVPSQQLQTIQSLDGGLVTDILVKEGDVINAGQTILKVDATRVSANLAETTSQYLALSAEVARLNALIQERIPQFPSELAAAAPDRLKHEMYLYETSKAELDELLAMQSQQQQQKQQELNEALAALAQYKQTLKLTQQELSVTRPLLESGAVSNIDILRLERAVATAKGEANRAAANVARAQSSVREAENKLSEVRLNMLNKWQNQLSDSKTKLAAHTEALTGLSDKVMRSDVKSPISGTVQRLHINTVGGVLTPGKDIVDLVPLNDLLVIEAKLPPKDIAFVKLDQQATIKFTAYDFSVFGALQATVSHISADTITDEKDNTFYVVRLTTKSRFRDGSLDILPGMTVQVDILTGKKTVLSYILKPISKATSNAMTER
ncbi:MAG: HlyD family type I secretion periplasmic adaptor subunit [Gammaproteobacteria bacterium]|nr:HlyD family type I secretion periplasmic adaptor subunit [Gammaproteobacteria bacterium]